VVEVVNNKTLIMAIDRKAYRAAKKKYKSTVRSNKKADKSDRKYNKKADKNLKKQKKKDLKTLKKFEQAGPRREYTLSRQKTRMIDPGDKPKRSDYKGSKPQKATGSSSSKRRAEAMINKMNKVNNRMKDAQNRMHKIRDKYRGRR